MWLFFAINIVSILLKPASCDDICTRDWAGIPDPLCQEYGFCSSCIANGCNWCTLTSNCIDSGNDCGVNNKLYTLEECHTEYENINRENPDIANTEYSPQIAEIMAVYSEYTYYENSDYDVFNLDMDTLRVFEDTVDSFTQNLECLFLGNDMFEAPDPTLKNELKKGFLKMRELSGHNDKEEEGDWGDHRVIVGIDTVAKAIVVAFRGTSNFPSVISFTNFCQIEWGSSGPGPGIKEDLSALKDVYGISTPVKIMEAYDVAYDYLKKNSGFYEYVLELINMEIYADYPVYITGHSLGGSLTNIFVLDLYAYFYNSQQLDTLDADAFVIYTFGQSRVGNDAFSTLINNIFNYKFYRVVHSNDPFPTMPFWPPPFNYRHSGIEIHYGAGDYKNTVMCQYRECLFMDPFEDFSCRNRYNSMLINYELPPFDVKHVDNYVAALWHNTINILDDFIEMSKEFISESGADDHMWYDELGQYGHCHAHDTIVKCNKADRSDINGGLNTNNYRCLNSLQCQTQYDTDSQCCYGSPRGPRRVCRTNNDNDNDNDNNNNNVCPLNDLGAFCILDNECKDWQLKSVKCVMGVCTDVGRREHQKCVKHDILITKSEKCSSFANDGKLNCCFGKGVTNRVISTCQEIDSADEACNQSPLGYSCSFDYNCLDWTAGGSVVCHHNICVDQNNQQQKQKTITSPASGSLLFIGLIVAMAMILVLLLLFIRNIFSYDKFVKYQVVSLASSDDQC